ncbi:MAG: hypothetical protein H0U70_00680 [Tatlockia sp.]|nr:hypothetical protein [Tatlockia sp.]
MRLKTEQALATIDTMRIYKLTISYLFFYFLFGILIFLLFFGWNDSLKILMQSPLESSFSGGLIFVSALFGSILIIAKMKERLSVEPYPYFMMGFYVGNCSLLILFLLDALFRKFIILKFPELIAVLLSFLAELLFSYIIGWAFLALIPAWISAYLTYKLFANTTDINIGPS